MLASKLGSKWIGMVLLTLLMLSLAPISIGYAQKQEGKRAEKFVEIAEHSKAKVDELFNFIEEIEDEITISEEITSNYTVASDKLDEAKDELEETDPDFSLVIDLAKEAMVTFRGILGQLNTLLEDSNVDTESAIHHSALGEAIDRAYGRIDRIKDATDTYLDLNPSADVSDVDGNLTWARGNLTEAQDALDLPEPNIEWAEGNLTEANDNIADAFAALRELAEWTNSWRIENFLTGIKKSVERTKQILERADRQGIDVAALLGGLGYGDEDGDGDIDIDDFLPSFEELINSARGKRGGKDIRGAIEDLKTIREELRDVHRGLAEQRKGGPGGKGKGK